MDDGLKQLLGIVLPFLGVAIPVLGLLLREAARSQRILNTNYEATLKRLEDVETDNKALRTQLAGIQTQYAEERGGLKQKVADLENQMQTERANSEKRSSDNAKEISTQAERLNAMKAAQRDLEERIEVVTSDRDRLNTTLEAVNNELVKVREHEKELMQRSEALTQQLLDKQTELDRYVRQLEGPKTP